MKKFIILFFVTSLIVSGATFLSVSYSLQAYEESLLRHASTRMQTMVKKVAKSLRSDAGEIYVELIDEKRLYQANSGLYAQLLELSQNSAPLIRWESGSAKALNVPFIDKGNRLNQFELELSKHNGEVYFMISYISVLNKTHYRVQLTEAVTKDFKKELAIYRKDLLPAQILIFVALLFMFVVVLFVARKV